MGDMVLNAGQVINGLAVLLSFFVGYQYAVKRHFLSEKSEGNRTEGGDGAEASPQHVFKSDSDNYKMVLVVRNDLKMGKGKIGAQCGHGAVGAYQKALMRTPRLVRQWEQCGCAKIALKVESEAELLAIKRAANMENLNYCMVVDAGRTQISPNTKTVLAIGPAAVELIDKVTGHLKLL